MYCFTFKHCWWSKSPLMPSFVPSSSSLASSFSSEIRSPLEVCADCSSNCRGIEERWDEFLRNRESIWMEIVSSFICGVRFKFRNVTVGGVEECDDLKRFIHFPLVRDKLHNQLAEKRRRAKHARLLRNLNYRDVYGGEEVAEKRRNGPMLSGEGIPVGLPPLHTVSQGKSGNHANSNSRVVNLIRPTSPRSPGASAFGIIEGSDDDEDILTESSKLDDTYMDSNGHAEILEENVNGEQMYHASTSMIRSHSVSGDLHGAHPDPVVADILRKEPEHETFVRLKITPFGFEMPTPNEVESYKVLQECLELRESYIFREAVAPWEKGSDI